ncbi:hypothetical protein [Cupriavidus taiwanensis]|uniref:hypothetical protein n=1 Tax=Cupriavidus taiwanensis TaxID=164546 RepID=UPI0018DE3B6F|nr:hypothetical protein [Cupriavidus taiwanensis]
MKTKMHVSPAIRTIINGREIPRQMVLEWEQRRAQIVLGKLGARPASLDLAGIRRQLLALKLELGAEGLMKTLRLELGISSPFAELTAAMSRGSRRFSVTELIVSGGTAEHFVDWFQARTRSNDELAMLSAAPDHYMIRTGAGGIQEVIETTGGAPFSTRFFIDYSDLSSLRSPPDQAYPHQIAGVARSAKGTALGGVRHQFRNEGQGFRAKLLVEFPLLILPQVVSGHQWHLASEFGNWIDACFA